MQPHSVMLSFAAIFLMVVVLFTSQPNITGFVPTNTQSQQLDITITESQRYKLSLENGPLKLEKFSISGTTEGTGLVNIYLTSGEKQYLVYTNKKKVTTSLAQITGLATSELIIAPGEKLDKTEELPIGYQAEQGTFTNVCLETCNMAGVQPTEGAYLDIVVQHAKVHLSGITFSTHE